MNPSIDDRLAGLIRAMSDIILPALESSGGLAHEQARLVVGTLHTIRLQLDDAPRFERAEVAAAEKLGNTLCSSAEGGNETQQAAKTLRQAIAEDTGITSSAMRAKLETIHSAIEKLTHAAGADGSEAFRSTLTKQILDYGKTTALFGRSWYSAMGFESANSRVPAIAEMLTQFENYR